MNNSIPLPPHSVPDTSLMLTAEQRCQFDEDGFLLIEDALTTAEVAALIELIDELDERYRQERKIAINEAFQMRNIVAQHSLFRRLIDHPRLLPLVVDTIGYNIQIRTSHMDVRPPMDGVDQQTALGAKDSFFPWHSDGPDFRWPTVQGIIPYMEVKVGYYLTDLTAHNSGAICVVRGSHRRQQIDNNGDWIVDPEDIVEVNVRPGTAMLWRTALIHALSPNFSGQTRKCLYYGYSYRWMRPADYDHQAASVLAGCTPMQRQLLGELNGDHTAYTGADPQVHPVSRYWRPQDEDIPLKAWLVAQQQEKSG